MANEINKKKLQSIQTREKLIDAATTRFSQLGYMGCSLDAIAQAAGITKGAVYTHFASKAEFFIAIIEYAYRRAVDRANELKTRLSWIDAIIELLSECARNPEFPIDHKLYTEILAVANRENEVKAAFLRYQDEFISMIEKWIQDGHKNARNITDIDVKRVTRMIFVLCNGLIVRLADGNYLDNNEDIKTYENTIRYLLKA